MEGAHVRIALFNPSVRYRFDGAVLHARTMHPHGFPASPSVPEEGIAVEVRLNEGRVSSLRLQRSITSSDELYYARSADGGFTVTDQFREALAGIPLQHRDTGEAALCNHFLFRTVPGAGTYCRQVHRVAHGEVIEWQFPDGRIRRSAVTVQVRDDHAGIAEGAARVDEALGEAVRATGADRMVNLLSGGIDSTLVQSYLAPGRPTVSATIDSPEFAGESNYARSASDLLGTRHELVHFPESEYFERLVSCIRALGMPPHHLQTVLIDAALQSGPNAFVTAQLADALFGLDVALRASRAWNNRRLLAHEWIGALLPGPLARRWHVRQATLASLRTDGPLHALALNVGVFAELPVVVRMFGEEAVGACMLRRFDYVQERTGGAGSVTDDVLGRQLERAHWTDFYCDDTVSIWRQLAHARDVALAAPFTAQRVVEASTTVASPDRYVAHGRTKPILKHLLRTRVPGYAVDQPKGGSGLPLVRYQRNGPLANQLRAYARPGFIDADLWGQLETHAPWTAWNALTYVVWEDECARAPVGATASAARSLALPM